MDVVVASADDLYRVLARLKREPLGVIEIVADIDVKPDSWYVRTRADKPLTIRGRRLANGRRPRLRCQSTGLGNHNGAQNLTIATLEITPRDRGATDGGAGVLLLGRGRDITVRDCHIHGWKDNLDIEGTDGDDGRYTQVLLEGNLITDARPPDGRGHGQGLYASRVDGLVVRGNVFDRNGHYGSGHRTIYDHNLYIQKDCGPIEATGNVFARGAATGLQARPGGRVEGNLFLANAVGLMVQQAATRVVGNIFAWGDDIAPGLPRGLGVSALPCEHVLLEDNLFVEEHSRGDGSIAVDLTHPSRAQIDAKVTVLPPRPWRATIRGNRFHRWSPVSQTRFWQGEDPSLEDNREVAMPDFGTAIREVLGIGDGDDIYRSLRASWRPAMAARLRTKLLPPEAP